MKIEDQLAKPDLTDVNIPKGIYENLPTNENMASLDDENDDNMVEEETEEKLRADANNTILT
jgi:hypothetical protein